MFVRTVLSGHRLVYEPSAIIWHDHRDNLHDLSRQMLAYGSGCTAALTALLLRSGKARRELPAKIVAGAIRVSAIGDRTKDNPVLPGLAKRGVPRHGARAVAVLQEPGVGLAAKPPRGQSWPQLLCMTISLRTCRVLRESRALTLDGLAGPSGEISGRRAREPGQVRRHPGRCGHIAGEQAAQLPEQGRGNDQHSLPPFPFQILPEPASRTTSALERPSCQQRLMK